MLNFTSDVEAFATAAFARDVWILEAESLVQAILDEIDLGAVDQLERLGIDDDLELGRQAPNSTRSNYDEQQGRPAPVTTSSMYD